MFLFQQLLYPVSPVELVKKLAYEPPNKKTEFEVFSLLRPTLLHEGLKKSVNQTPWPYVMSFKINMTFQFFKNLYPCDWICVGGHFFSLSMFLLPDRFLADKFKIFQHIMFLIFQGCQLNVAYYEDIVEERKLQMMCGYPLCNKKLKFVSSFIFISALPRDITRHMT